MKWNVATSCAFLFKTKSSSYSLKGRVQCFSIEVLMKKCFLNPEKKDFVQILSCLVVFEKTQL